MIIKHLDLRKKGVLLNFLNDNEKLLDVYIKKDIRN